MRRATLFAMQRFGRRATLVAGMSLLLGVSCLSPTLPLPPPNPPEVEGPTETGRVRLSGRVIAHAIVFARNESSRLVFGEATGADGEYSFFMDAQVGDIVTLWYQSGTDTSPQHVFQIEPPTGANTGGTASGGSSTGGSGTGGSAGAPNAGGAAGAP